MSPQAAKDAGEGRSRKSLAVRLSAEERREQLLVAARKVFTDAGLGGATITDIAREAGVTEALLYRYFEGKDDLFESAVLEPLDALTKSMAEQTDVFSLVDGRTRLAMATEIHQRLCEAMTEIAPMLLAALFSNRGHGERLWKNRVAPFVDNAARSAGDMRRGWEHSPIDPRLQFLAIFGMHLAVALDAHFRGEEVDCELVSRELAYLTAKGVTARKSSPGGG